MPLPQKALEMLVEIRVEVKTPKEFYSLLVRQWGDK